MENGYEPPAQENPFVDPAGPTDQMPAVRQSSDTWQYPAQPAPHSAQPLQPDQAAGYGQQAQPGWPGASADDPWGAPAAYSGWSSHEGWSGIPDGPIGTGEPRQVPDKELVDRGMATGSPLLGASPGWAHSGHTSWAASPPPPGAVAGAFEQPPTAAGPKHPVRRRILQTGAAAFVAAATLVAGIGIGHELWRPAAGSALSASSSNGGSSAPGATSPSNGTTGGGGAGNNGNPFGNFPFGGSLPSGSTGSSGPFGGFGSFPSGSSTSGGGSTSSAPGSPSNVSSIASKVDPGLVDVDTVLGDEDGEAAGTGIVLTSNGEVLTNNHVIDGATSISVTDIGSGTTYKATVVGYDRTGDIAVLQLQGASGLTTASLDNASDVSVGEPVVAIGNAGGVGGTPSVAGGKVTSVDQSITASDEGGGNPEYLHGLIEINADIQPGDSGGSLVDSSGQVIGIDTAASTGTAVQDETTQGYAIPIGTALGIAQQIVTGQGSSTVHIGETAFLGVEVSSTGSGTSTAGAAVEGAVSGAPAAAAGIGAGDVITSVGGVKIASTSALTDDLETHHPGDQVGVTWLDSSGNSHSATITLADGPAA